MTDPKTFLACGFYLYSSNATTYPTNRLAHIRVRREGWAMDLTPDECDALAKALTDAAAHARTK